MFAQFAVLFLAVQGPQTNADSVPLYSDLGTHHYTVTTAVPKAQQYFDQGLRLTYAFNHAEAIRAFREAARLDSTCAMCWWGVALAYGPNINAPMDSASGVEAYQAIQRAQALAPKATPKEQAFIRALATRYAPIPPADRAPLDSAYAAAMGEVARQYPDDHEAATFYAEAVMDLSPWYYWTKAGEPRPQTPEIVGSLERVLAANPNHPGACHYYIHAVEAAEPKKAEPCADRLAGLMPGAGHLVHMPAHIYIRVGRWADAVENNQHAVHADESYIADQRPSPNVYPLAYYPHNLHFLGFAATMAGQSTMAIDAMRKASEQGVPDVLRQVPPLQLVAAAHPLTLVTFGRWDEILALSAPPADLVVMKGLNHYARGVANAAKGRWPAAEAELDSVRAAAKLAQVPPTDTVMMIADHALAGEIAHRRGDLDAAVTHFTAAMALEDALVYSEPPHWYYPIRHSLGAVLLEAGRPADAEKLYREDLARFPENGWALFGLAQSLEAQGKAEEARQVKERFGKAWAKSTVTLTASRF